MASSSSSSSPPVGGSSKETDSLLHDQSEQLPAAGWDVFLSHSGEQKGFVKDLFKMLSPFYKVFFDIDRPSLPLGERFPPHIFHAAKTCRVAVVVLSNEFLCSKWPMLELSTFFDAGVQVLPLFYELSPKDLSNKEKLQEWDKRWAEFAAKDVRIMVSSWAQARQKLCSINGLLFKKADGELAYLEEVVSAIYQMNPPLFRSSHAGVHGRDRLCKVFIDKFEELKRRRRLQDRSADLHNVYLLGVYGLPGSGKSTLCACLHDHFFSSFFGKALLLKLPTDPTPPELLGIAKQLLKLTDLGHNRERMISEIEDLSQMFHILKASNLRTLRVFLVIDNISSPESIDLVEDILQLGVGEGSRVMLVARTLEILHPVLNSLGNPDNHVHYKYDTMTVPSLNEEEAICVLLQHAGVNLASDYGQKMEGKYSSSHRETIAKVALMCAFHNKSSSQYPLYLPLALKFIGSQLKMDFKTWSKQLLRLNPGMVEELKEGAVRKIVEESYQKLPEKLKLLFLDVALFMIPYSRFPKLTDELVAVELLGFMHECRPEKIKRELDVLVRHCFLEYWGREFGVHDVFLEFAKCVPGASSMYYCKRNIADLQKVMWDLSMRAHRSPAVLRALILEVDEKCKRFEFPAGLSSVKVVVVRQCKSLEVLGLAGLTSLVSLEIEDCPRLRHLDLDPGHAYTLKSVRCVGKKWGDCIDVADQQQGSCQKSLLQMVQAGSGMPRLINKVWCRMPALGRWHFSPPINKFMNLGIQLKALEVLRLEQTGITSLVNCSSCWPQLRVLEVFEIHLEVIELGKLPNLKRFVYQTQRMYDYRRGENIINEHRMARKPNLLAGCPELEDVQICNPSYEDGMGTVILPPNVRGLVINKIVHGESVLPDFTSSAHSLERLSVQHHFVLQNIRFTCQFLNLVTISLWNCPSLVTISGLEWLPMLQVLSVRKCAKLQSLENLEALKMLEYLYLNDCPVLAISSGAPSSQHLVDINMWECPNAQFLASGLENLTALRELACNVFGNMFKLKNLVKLERVSLDWKRDRQANNPLSLCSHDDEAKCEQVNGNIAQVQGMKYVPLLVVGESAAPSLSQLSLRGVQNLVSLDGIHCLRTLKYLELQDLPKLTCLQGLESLIDLKELYIRRCTAVKELRSLCSLVNLCKLSIIDCVNLILLEGLHNMRALEHAKFERCENLEHLELGPDHILEQLSPERHRELALWFRGCKFASIQAMVGWVLDEKVSKAVLGASLDALTWELTSHLLERPRERMDLAEQLVATLGVYCTRKPPALTDGDGCFDFEPWVDMLKATWEDQWGDAAKLSFPRGLEELMEKVGRVPLKEVLQQCQTDAHFRASAANCIIEADHQVLRRWIDDLVKTYMGFSLWYKW